MKSVKASLRLKGMIEAVELLIVVLDGVIDQVEIRGNTGSTAFPQLISFVSRPKSSLVVLNL